MKSLRSEGESRICKSKQAYTFFRIIRYTIPKFTYHHKILHQWEMMQVILILTSLAINYAICNNICFFLATNSATIVSPVGEGKVINTIINE